MRFPSRLTDVWLPLGPVVPTFPPSHGVHPGLYGIGRMKPGVTYAQAAADMQYWQRRLQRSVTEMRRLRSGRSNRSRITPPIISS